MKRNLIRAVLLTSAFSIPGAALAQSSAQASDQPSPGDTMALGGNEIIVTAQKFEQRAQDVPITISAVGGQRIEELGITDLDELSNYVPGLNIQEQSANNPGIVIRGITSDSGSSQQGPRVTLYYNGVDISRSRGSYQAIYDVDRIEVVKGPQATLFGTASAVGAISIISARPQPGFSAEIKGGYGNYDATLLSGFANAGNDVVAGRVAFEWRKRDGYVENLASSQTDDLYAQDQLGIRASLRFTPGERFTLDLIGTYDRQRNGGTPFISGTYPTEAGPADPFGSANLGGSPLSEQVLGNSQLGLERDVYDINLTATYEISDTISFTTVNGYREFDSAEVFDADGSAAWYLEFAEIAEGWQFSHEGRFAYNTPALRASLGWNYFTEDGRQNVPFSSEEGIFLQCAANIIPGLGCVVPGGVVTAAQTTALATGGAVSQIPYRSVFENQGQNDSYSIFADATWAPIPEIELTAGVRALWEKRKSGYYAEVAPSVLTGGPSLIPGQIDTNGQTFEASEDYSAVLPRFNLLWRASDTVNLYATVAKGRRSPVVQLNARRDPAGNPVPNLQLVPQETVWNYEGGVKISSGFFSGSLGVYYQKYDGFQVSVIQDDGTTITQSAGTASNLGVEAEMRVQPTDWLSVFFNIGYIDGGIDDDNTFAPQFSGARFRLQPEWQASAGLTVDYPITESTRVFFTPSFTHRSRIFFEVPNNPLISQGPVTLVNLRGGFSFADERFEIAGFMRNATDEDYLLDAGNTGGAFGIPTFIPAEPRFYGIELTARIF